jgi:putative ABC transport system substrate-binding protein
LVAQGVVDFFFESPLDAYAQQPDRVRRLGLLTPFADDDPVGHARLAAFLRTFQQLGWMDGGNVRIETC